MSDPVSREPWVPPADIDPAIHDPYLDGRGMRWVLGVLILTAVLIVIMMIALLIER